MIESVKILIIVCSLIFGGGYSVTAQFGIGGTLSFDIYNVHSNPTINSGSRSSGNGSAFLNLGLGPKIWYGSDRFSVSAETQANLGLFGLSIKDYKGLGSISFPIIAKLNFGGMSALNKEGEMGYSIGGGIQYTKTELYGLNDDATADGITRPYYRTYIVQAGLGFGMSGFTGAGFIRYGFNPGLDGAHNFHIGIQTDFNFLKLKKIKTIESEL